MNRIFGIVLASAWIVAMTALIRQDLWPYWTAGEPPYQLVPEEAYQVGIYLDSGCRLGTAWVTATVTQGMKMVNSATLLDLGAVRTVLPLRGPLLFENNLHYQSNDTLDQFDFRLRGMGLDARIDAERYGRDFGCTLKMGAHTWTISLEGRQSEFLGESLRPFTRLTHLTVGQTWRIRVLDPFVVLQDQALEFKTQLATVVARERIRHRGKSILCFRIETDGAVAWVDRAGCVLRQEVSVPLLGRFILTDEPFDRAARAEALAAPPAERPSAELLKRHKADKKN